MSQKVRIIKVRHAGTSVYLGDDSCRNHCWTRNPERIMDWLCDGWRTRFNQHREHRTIRRYMEDVESRERMWVDVPLGGATVGEPFKDSEARIRCSWLACIPAAVLASPMRVENSEWYAALKRKKINGGRIPGFKSRKRDPQYFVCWRNQTKTGNAVYHQVSRKRGVVVITGTVKKEFRKPGETGCRWRLSIHVRVSQPIRDYTSVAVNWTERTLAFTNEPSPIRRNATGKQTGIDRGCVHTLALSNGTMLDMPQPSERERREYLRLQRKLARQDMTNSRRGGKTAKFQSKRRKLTMEHKGMPRPDPDAAPLWAWARWVDSKGRAHTRPDRRYSGFRDQYDGLELLHLRVDENRVLCTDFDQFHCVINNWPCAPLDAGTWPPAEYDRWLDEHWDDPPDAKAVQYRRNAIVDPKRLPDRWIQACLWTITPHDVVDIRPACGKPDTIGNHG